MKLAFLVPATACLLLLLALSLQATADARILVGVSSLPAGSWSDGERWCNAQGRGGLIRLPGSEAAVRARLAAAAGAGMQPGRCYWAAPESPAAMEELRWMAADSGDSTVSGDGSADCVCASRVVASRGGSPRIRLVNCHRRLPFLCRRQQQEQPQQEEPAQNHQAPRRTPTTPSAKHPPVEFVPDETSDDPDAMEDEPVDHDKFPMSGLLPLGLLPTVGGSATANSAVPSARTAAAAVSNATSTTATGAPATGALGLLSEGQRSEFITLLVLYSIVGVVCCVLLGLCVVRCCRGRFGRARIRYVKQVNADDIPRFMPSSWA